MSGCRTVLLTATCVLWAGCSGEGPDRYAISGTVKLDGQPVEDGQIVFTPIEGTAGPSTGGTIENGSYSIPADKGAVAGEHRVEIRWPKPTGKMVTNPLNPSHKYPEKVEAIPSRYNEESELVRDVQPGGNSGGEFDFDLQSGGG